MNAWRRHAAPGYGDAMTRTPLTRSYWAATEMANQPIFFDASGRRAARIKILVWVVGLAVCQQLDAAAAWTTSALSGCGGR